MNEAIFFLGGYMVGLVIGWALGQNNSPSKPDESLLKYIRKPIPFTYINPHFPPKENK